MAKRCAPRYVAVAALLGAVAMPALAVDVFLTTGNDFLTNNPTSDDLYTFGLAIEVDRDPYRIALRENAFTDRQAGVRFDETYLTVARALRPTDPWSVVIETGVVHVGRGLFGQRTQNAFHRLVGDAEVDLPYYQTSVHPYVRLDSGRLYELPGRIAIGPRFEVSLAPGLRSDAVIEAQALWRPVAGLAILVRGGGRRSHASLEPLKPHVAPLASVVGVALDIRDYVVLSWTYNEFGDKREHVSLGFRIPIGPRERVIHEASSENRLGR
jgi:hypothetical protein